MSEKIMIRRSFDGQCGHARVKNPCHQGLALAVLCLAQYCAAQEPAVKFEIFPTDIHLNTSRAEQSIVCRIVQPDGITRDVTHEVQWLVPDSKIVRMDGNILRPISDGAGQLKAKYRDQTAAVSVSVKEAKLDHPISFKLDVMPVFMRAGCNVGSCHGSARGKDGFHLSLFGFDPDGDYDRLTRELSTRRINLAIPQESLLIQKGLGAVPHTGGVRFHQGDYLYNALIRWLDAGAPPDSPGVAHADSLEILPKQLVLEGEGARQQMTVRAHYSD